MNYFILYFNEKDPIKKILYENLMSIKERLVYLETKECRQNMLSELRLQKIKYATEMFRNLLKRKEELDYYIQIKIDDDN